MLMIVIAFFKNKINKKINKKIVLLETRIIKPVWSPKCFISF